jgi:hypothetical protein
MLTVNVISSFMKDRPLQITAVGVLLLVMAASVLSYVYLVSTPLIRGDDWYYTNTIVKSYLDGHLSIIDFFSKRGPGENAQPINRLILLGLVQWFQMDFRVQGLLGAFLAFGCVALLTFLAWRESYSREQPRALLLPLGLGAVILSLNAHGDYGWPLVTALVYTGTLGISLYFYFAASLSEKGAWFRLGALTFAVLVLLDTFATLAVLGAVLLILARVPDSQHRWRTAATALAAFLGLFIYQHLFAWFTGTVNSPLGADDLLGAADYMLQNLGSAWKPLVAPFGAALFEPPPGMPYPWMIMGVLALLMWPLHGWFWWRFKSERHNRIAFLAGGLMLYCYGTIAGMLVDRVPSNGFDYLLQPRYVAFYQLQLVALLLMWSRSSSWSGIRHHVAWATTTCGLLLCLNALSAAQAWRSKPYFAHYDQRMVSQIKALADNPADPPEDCLQEINPCRWPESSRRQVLQILESHGLNAFSPEFRARHGYVWQVTNAKH